MFCSSLLNHEICLAYRLDLERHIGRVNNLQCVDVVASFGKSALRQYRYGCIVAEFPTVIGIDHGTHFFESKCLSVYSKTNLPLSGSPHRLRLLWYLLRWKVWFHDNTVLWTEFKTSYFSVCFDILKSVRIVNLSSSHCFDFLLKSIVDLFSHFQ